MCIFFKTHTILIYLILVNTHKIIFLELRMYKSKGTESIYQKNNYLCKPKIIKEVPLNDG